MIGKSIYKVPDGKLVKISLDSNNGKINSVKIMGDFFLYPEKGVELIEKSLSGNSTKKDSMVSAIDSCVKENNLDLFGINSEGIAKAILIAEENSQ